MARSVKMIDVFLPCPSDVLHEKQFIVESANEWNALNGRERGCYINILTWESIVSSGIADRPQSVINEQIGDEYDVYIGIMWGRFGAPTGKYESGTVEEFERALHRHRVDGNVHVSMFFKDAPLPLNILDGGQYDKVRNFRERYGREGGVYHAFVDDESLRTFINRLFSRVAGNESILPNSTAVDKPEVEVDCAVEVQDETYSEMGLFDWNDKLSEVVGVQVKFLDTISEKMSVNTKITEGSAEEIDAMVRLGAVDSGDMSRIMTVMAASLDELSEIIEEGMSSFSLNNEEMVRLTTAGFDIMQGFDGDDQKADWKKSVLNAIEGLGSFKIGAKSLVESISSTPRLTLNFNKARKRFVKIQNEMIEELSRAEALLQEVVRNAEEEGW